MRVGLANGTSLFLKSFERPKREEECERLREDGERKREGERGWEEKMKDSTNKDDEAHNISGGR